MRASEWWQLELDGRKGLYKLAGDKQRSFIGLGASLVARELRTEFDVRHFVGKATFGMRFRRPLFSVFQNIFDEIIELEGRAPFLPRNASLDKVVMVTSLVPMMCTNLRAQIDPEISVTDGLPTGGGAAVATEFMEPPETVIHDGRQCYECGQEVNPRFSYPCPAECGAAMCSLKCTWGHRDADHPADCDCPRRLWKVPRFGERFAGKRAPLSHAVALQGGIEVQLPYDLHFGNDMFTDQGREQLKRLCEDGQVVAEHWAPECRLFSKARGRPIVLRDGTTIRGPQPVRDEAHVMGFPWLSGEMKGRLRKSNNMALRALKRGETADADRRYWSLEHPYGSWLWEFTIAKRLEAESGFEHSVGSHCCWGGRREKWYSFFSNMPSLLQYLQVDCPGHEGLLNYEVQQRADGTLEYPTEEEAEYPWALCIGYAKALKAQLERDGLLQQTHLKERANWYQAALEQTTARLASPLVAPAAAAVLARWELMMAPGDEMRHLKELLRSATHRGSDIRLFLDTAVATEEALHELPYPALRWRWKTILAFPWKQEGHINELEMNTVAVFLRRRGRSFHRRGQRFFHILDYMVSRSCLAKGRSSLIGFFVDAQLTSWRRTTTCCPCGRWNFSDKASRLHEAR